MLKIGLTGGIGSGKSTVARLFSELGVPVIDADLIARSLVEPGEPGLVEIQEAFGASLVIDGHLDRPTLRKLIFQSPSHRKLLESILHPRVFAAMEKQSASLIVPYCLFAIPLLIETGRMDFVDRVLVIDCPESSQMKRVRERDGIEPKLINAMIKSQSSRTERLQAADDIILNTGTLEELAADVGKLHIRYLDLAQGRALWGKPQAID